MNKKKVNAKIGFDKKRLKSSEKKTATTIETKLQK